MRIMGLSLASSRCWTRTVVLEMLKEREQAGLLDYWTYHPYTRNPDTSYPVGRQVETATGGL